MRVTDAASPPARCRSPDWVVPAVRRVRRNPSVPTSPRRALPYKPFTSRARQTSAEVERYTTENATPSARAKEIAICRWEARGAITGLLGSGEKPCRARRQANPPPDEPGESDLRLRTRVGCNGSVELVVVDYDRWYWALVAIRSGPM